MAGKQLDLLPEPEDVYAIASAPALRMEDFGPQVSAIQAVFSNVSGFGRFMQPLGNQIVKSMTNLIGSITGTGLKGTMSKSDIVSIYHNQLIPMLNLHRNRGDDLMELHLPDPTHARTLAVIRSVQFTKRSTWCCCCSCTGRGCCCCCGTNEHAIHDPATSTVIGKVFVASTFRRPNIVGLDAAGNRVLVMVGTAMCQQTSFLITQNSVTIGNVTKGGSETRWRANFPANLPTDYKVLLLVMSYVAETVFFYPDRQS
eukprot:c12307_g1_i1.p1 GENE.c12307_g1_i1~~c12307_g1_i1.p1  ORF type:complete len:257 (+),score=42.85 c12307_g1_i1:57-827(+)